MQECVHVSLQGSAHMCKCHRGQQRALEFLELELQCSAEISGTREESLQNELHLLGTQETGATHSLPHAFSYPSLRTRAQAGIPGRGHAQAQLARRLVGGETRDRSVLARACAEWPSVPGTAR
ncbi:hypothetical protein U0070_022679 [Myodes glareolus]|uniref:Uncharacterized protein n=1 Tax=Myodes glareolus TaxID=447135 RepID=A0AAW0I0T3_MYOGA